VGIPPDSIKGDHALECLALDTYGAAKRKLPEAKAASSRAARCPEPSINPQARNKRDDRLGETKPAKLRRGLGAALATKG